MKQILKKLSLGESLTLEEAKYAMDKVLDNGATYAQIGAYLSLLRQKGETVEEITGSAMMMKEKAMHIAANSRLIESNRNNRPRRFSSRCL